MDIINVKLIVNFLTSVDQQHLKNLDQADRKLCALAVDLFLSGKDSPEMNSLDPKRIEKLECALFPRISTPTSIKRPLNVIIRLISSLYKGVMNLLFNRISSKALFDKIQSAKEKFLRENFQEYLAANCTITPSCSKLEDAHYYFMSVYHPDPHQKVVQKNIIEHFTTYEEGNVLLLEGLAPSYPKLSGGKQILVDSWDKEDIYLKQRQTGNNLGNALKQLKNEKTEANKLAVAQAITELHKVKLERNQHLILKAVNYVDSSKIFLMAGESHLHRIPNIFKDDKCVMITFKISDARRRQYVNQA